MQPDVFAAAIALTLILMYLSPLAIRKYRRLRQLPAPARLRSFAPFLFPVMFQEPMDFLKFCEDPEVRLNVVKQLPRRPFDLLALAYALLNDPDDRIRREAVLCIRRMSHAVPAAGDKGKGVLLFSNEIISALRKAVKERRNRPLATDIRDTLVEWEQEATRVTRF